ncbi:MAG: hypothetical protein ABW061_27055, partial [Polyangiaceae bacterium]
MPVRSLLVFFVLLGVALQGCKRTSEPTPNPDAPGTASAAKPQALKPVEPVPPTVPVEAPVSRHANDLPDVPMAHPPS